MCWVCDPFDMNSYDQQMCKRGRVFNKLSQYYLDNGYSKEFSIGHSMIYPMIVKTATKKIHDRIKLQKILSYTLLPCVTDIIIKYIKI